jgi:hypothetical protein
MVDFSPLYVRFALIAAKWMRRSELSRRAICYLMHRSK